MTIQQLKKEASQKLTKSPSPQLDIEVLLQFALNQTRTQLLLNRDKEIEQEKLEWLEKALSKRQNGLPIAYITGHKEFYGFDFIVSPAVLIPKPDTEILVERAIEIILEKIEAHPNAILTVCDMCTGSGCIGISVLRTLYEVYKIPENKLPKFTLVDISSSALDIASKNIEQIPNIQERIRIVRSNLFEQVPGSFDVILTNPPYIPRKMVDELLKDGRSEPRLALDGDVVTIAGGGKMPGESSDTDDGLALIRDLIPQAKQHLSPLGIILMETGEYNAKAAASYSENYGFSSTIHKDLEGQLRVVELNLHSLRKE